MCPYRLLFLIFLFLIWSPNRGLFLKAIFLRFDPRVSILFLLGTFLFVGLYCIAYYYYQVLTDYK